MGEPRATRKAQLADMLRKRIEHGDLKPGTLFPTEELLIEETRLGRDTVRAAIGILEREGLIGPGPRRRKQVISRQLLTVDITLTDQLENRRREYPGIDGFVAAVRAGGGVPDQEITIGLVKASSEVAEALRVEPGMTVVERRRLRFVDGLAHDLDISYYTEELAVRAPKLKSPDNIPEGAVMYLAGLGIVQKWYDNDEEARPATAAEAQLLNIAPNTPLLVYMRTGLLADLSPVRYTVTYWPGTRVRLHSRIPA